MDRPTLASSSPKQWRPVTLISAWTGFSMAIGTGHLEDFAEIAGIEYLVIDKDTTLSSIKKELRWNELYYHLARGL